ncbi:putative metallo-dependent hydrolases superfamily, peptidase M19 family protein [Lyophyllum shimeji]|uniref:Dipeptidase n=1 Tax=Lyophyllum shimeji TaxID=47721 RepID=A0A9P3PKV9_LYOSH|nr:putative metallo-dependent hydrolases superfamily, peptidase M19 family protein [Lyophyllum shimeji]
MSSQTTPTETSSLLPGHRSQPEGEDGHGKATHSESNLRTRGIVWGALTILLFAGLVLFVGFQHVLEDRFYPLFGLLPKDPILAALAIMEKAPVIDGHIDLPFLTRLRFANNASAIDMESRMPGHVDIPRLRQGKVGGFFWSVYMDCLAPGKEDRDFLTPNWSVRDTLEQIDIARLLMKKYPETFHFATGSDDIKFAIQHGKIASLMGVEGGHQLGNSLAVLRQYHALGVRYVTLTHTCHNAFADSCGFEPGMIPRHHGLSSLGRTLIEEMNRLGVLIDLSHTSDATAAQALNYSKAPVIWSHSSARAVHDVPRNVPDNVLRLIGTKEGQKDAVVMVNFAPFFVAEPGQANVQAVADHVEHIAAIAGKQHVGIGSDYDGIDSVPVGLEDVSKYPALIAELYKRGWNKYELAGLAGANLLRVFQGAEKISRELQAAGQQPAYDLYRKRKDIPRMEL